MMRSEGACKATGIRNLESAGTLKLMGCVDAEVFVWPENGCFRNAPEAVCTAVMDETSPSALRHLRTSDWTAKRTLMWVSGSGELPFAMAASE